MKILVTHLIPNFILVSSMIYIWHHLLNKKINLKNPKLYITLISIMIISIFNFLVVNSFIRIILITMVFILFFKFLFNEDIIKSIITPICYQILIMISEAICILLLVTIFRLDILELKEAYVGAFIINVAISIMSIIIVHIPFIRKINNLIFVGIEKINRNFLIILSLSVISVANVLTSITYDKVDIRILIIINVIFTLFCFLVVLYSFKMQSSFNKVSDKYNVAINSLTDYENMMNKYKIYNHENKNLLLTIRAMIVNKEKDIPKYIDSIVKDKYEDNEKLLLKMNVIPSGGLRATIYSEILKIKDNNINYSLFIDNRLKAIGLIELDTDTIIDICKIICVFIDNAIEEVKNLKTRNIGISLYLDEGILNIKVTNNYQNKINIDKIYEEGYTTKGKGHGFGLCLVNKIVEGNKIFDNKTEISKEIFSQILLIKYKKTHK